MIWRLEIGKFNNYSVKNLKVANASGLTLFLTIKLFSLSILHNLWYILLNFMTKFVFRASIFPFFYACIFLKEVFFIVIRYNFDLAYIFSIFIVYLLYCIRLIRLIGDIEQNPGPKPSSFKNFSICHWNLNSITSHDFLKVKLLTA